MKRKATPPNNTQSPSTFAGLDVCDTAGLTLVHGARRPLYDDDVWDLTELANDARQATRSTRLWNFASITKTEWRYVAKDISLAFLAPRHVDVICLPLAFRTPRSPGTVFVYLKEWILWLNWLSDNAVGALGDVTDQHCDAYLEHRSWSIPRPGLPSRRLDPSSVKNYVKAVQAIAFYGGLFRHDRYAPDFVPWSGRPAARVAGYSPGRENTTQPVPDEVFRPLLANALYHVDVIGSHVADLAETVRTDPLRWNIALPQVDQVNSAVLASFLDVLDEYRLSRRPLPRLDPRYVQERLDRGWNAADPLLTVHIGRLLREAGFHTTFTGDAPEPLRALLEEALAEVGTGGLWARDAARVGHAVTGEMLPWTDPLGVTDVHRIVSYTLSSTLIVTAALTGMRHSELLEITTGARRVAEVAPGRLRYRVSSKLIKGAPLGGIDEEWVVVEEVYRAIGLAERLTGAKSGQPLFGAVALKPAVENFRRWCSEPFAQRLGLAVIPEGPVNGRMFRRTLARAIATRPNGLLAAKIHLKHLSVATTEGYAARPGGSQAHFRAEIEDEEHQHHLQLTTAAYQQYLAGVMPTGPGARDLIAAFRHIDDQLQTPTASPTVLDNERRIENLLRQRAKTLHVGVANFCWFTDPSKALCLRLAGTTQGDKPIIGMCDSSRCPQATHHQEHRPVWLESAQTVQTFLGNPRIPKLEKVRLQGEYDRSMRIVSALDKAASRPTEPS